MKKENFLFKKFGTIPSSFLRMTRIKYPKITIFLLSIILSYFVFTLPSIERYLSSLGEAGYLGAFIAGLLFSFGFTTPLAIGLLINLNPPNIILAAFLGGAGALLSDLLIFQFIKSSFIDEFNRLQKFPSFQIFKNNIERSLPRKISIYLFYALAGAIIASPLPDELGLSLLAGLTTINLKKLAVISFIMNTLGILIILLIGQ